MMKNTFYYSDGLLTLFLAILSGFSLFMVYSSWSISSIVFGESTLLGIVSKQIIFMSLAFFVYIIAAKIPYRIYYRYAYVLWIISVFLLIIVFKSEPVNDSKSWIQLPLFNFQPSEFAKLTMILSVGKYYQNLFDKKGKITLGNGFALPLAIYVLIPSALVFFQPDPGTVLIMLFISVSCLWFSGITIGFFIRFSSKIFMFFIVASVFLFSVNFFTSGALVTGFKESQARMIGRLDYKDPCADYYGEGFQICNSLIAINSGGLTGKGIGNSTQKYLYIPEAHTDAIFAVTAEELGFVGVGMILLIYLFVVIRILYYTQLAPNRFTKIILGGISGLILIHVFVNVGGIINFIPFTGVPLPFFSYGGTFLIMCAGFMGVAQSIIISIKRDGDINDV